MDITELSAKYRNIDIDDFSGKHKEELQKLLMGYKSSDLDDIEQHKMFLRLLRKFRLALINDWQFIGKNFKERIENLLAVGEAGLYSNKHRFLYELIQNVDDCDFDDLSNCSLIVKFEVSDENNTITLTYNEKGFAPRDVFAITGIAEEIKNIDENKMEIGEKGIGFKSVFGIADSVLIQSGFFSFEIYSSDFLLPELRYDNYAFSKGTKLTLKLKEGITAHKIYNEIAEDYSKSDTLFQRNPILFLNKLTDVKFYIDDAFRYLKFRVDRPAIECDYKHFEENVAIAVDNRDEGTGQSSTNEIRCYRYSLPILYDRYACISRYTKNSKLNIRKHKLVAVIPHESELNKVRDSNGGFYSFLPLQIELTIPILLHAPYKLDTSREYVDSQNNNKWFCDTNEKLAELVTWAFQDLAKRIKQKIVYYLPKKNNYLFTFNDQKTHILKKDCFQAINILEQKIFYTAEKTYEKSSDIISFRSREGIASPEKIHSLLSLSKKLFIPDSPTDMSDYGVDICNDAYKKLFIKALSCQEITGSAFEVLANNDFDFSEALSDVAEITLTADQIFEICKYERALAAFNANSHERIKEKKHPRFSIETNTLLSISKEYYNVLNDALEYIDAKKPLGIYLRHMGNQYKASKSILSGQYFICKETLILSREKPLDSFASFGEKYAKSLMAQLRVRTASENLNYFVSDDNMDDVEFLKKLIEARSGILICYGSKFYRNYIQLINKSATNNRRFINELLQNADDCNYSETQELPCFELSAEGDILRTYYNENGFTKANVRALTAIGESTKKQLSDSSNDSPIGEKGVGFKSVFTVATEVIIHSKRFNFSLTDKTPTIPKIISESDYSNGTMMTLKLNEISANITFTDEAVLHLCLCLRKLKRIRFNESAVEIGDGSSRRDIYVGEEKYSFEKFVYAFTVNNTEAIKEREDNQRVINRNQEIVFYIPKNQNAVTKVRNYYLYSGLPTYIKMNIPLIIDAPFEVTTSREGITHGLWNQIIRNEIYNALIEMLHSRKHDVKNEIFKFVNCDGIFVNDWLNRYPLKEKIAREELVFLTDGTFASPSKQKCWIYNEVCHYLFDKGMVTVPQRSIVRSPKYFAVLEWIGCERCSLQDLFSVISEAVGEGHITDNKFRNLLYHRLKQKAPSIHSDVQLRLQLINLAIVPTMSAGGGDSVFTTSNQRIFSSPDLTSTEEYCILDERLLSIEDYREIFRESVEPMNEKQRSMLYWERIKSIITNTGNKEMIAEMLLYEFSNNRRMLETCKDELSGYRYRIPLQSCNGEFYSGNKFINSDGEKFLGYVANRLSVSQKYLALASFLECASIHRIQYDDIDIEVDRLTSDDLTDFYEGGFENGTDIIRAFYDDGKLSYELLEKHGLMWIIREEKLDEEFPKNPITNLERLRERILSANLNEYIEETIIKTERRPKFRPPESAKRDYVLYEYQARSRSEYHFCQMCQEPKLKKYIEINAIEFEPKYYWNQMQLCLCLECSKDFEKMRNKKDNLLYSKFLYNLGNVDTRPYYNEQSAVAISGNHKIHFTATHLAEVQVILKRQSDLDISKNGDR